MSVPMKKLAAIAAASTMIFGLAACSSERTTEEPPADTETGGATDSDTGSGDDADAEGGGLIGIAMPTRSLERWNNDGAHLESLLQDMGYETSLQFADNQVDQQVTQLQNMINQEPEVLVAVAARVGATRLIDNTLIQANGRP